MNLMKNRRLPSSFWCNLILQIYFLIVIISYLVISIYCSIGFIVSSIIGLSLFVCTSYMFFRAEFCNCGRMKQDKCLYNENKISKRPIENIFLQEIIETQSQNQQSEQIITIINEDQNQSTEFKNLTRILINEFYKISGNKKFQQTAGYCKYCQYFSFNQSHHCTMFGNCIGIRNYGYYYRGLQIIMLYFIVMIITFIAELIFVIREHDSMGQTSQKQERQFQFQSCLLGFFIVLCFLTLFLAFQTFIVHYTCVKQQKTIRDVEYHRKGLYQRLNQQIGQDNLDILYKNCLRYIELYSQINNKQKIMKVYKKCKTYQQIKLNFGKIMPLTDDFIQQTLIGLCYTILIECWQPSDNN